jgi:hypothetical protein
VARSTKTIPTKLKPGARKPAASTKAAAAPVAPTAPPPAKIKASRAAPARPAEKAAPGRPTVAAPTAAVAARVPPPSKGELRAQIEKLEAANIALKSKSREATRAAKLAARRVVELEAEIVQLHEAAAKVVAPAEPLSPVKLPRGGRPARRSKPIDPGDGVPPGVAVQEPEPLDAEATAARAALEENLSGE